MRLSPLWLLAGAGVLGANASAHAVAVDQSPAHLLHARSPFSFSIGGLTINLGGSKRTCPRNFTPNGTGRDGYDYDEDGNGRPSWAVSGFKYFGASYGWLPSYSFTSYSSSWSIPTQCAGKIGKAVWWRPGSAWKRRHASVSLSFDIPSWWDFVQYPSRKGTDGWQLDIYGKGRPSYIPSGWLYFGAEAIERPQIGWAPTASWSCSSSFEFPSAFLSICDKVKWWKPSAGWLSAHTSVDLDFTPPSFWGVISVPSRSWKCNGSGKDGWSVDIYGKGRPSWVPSTGWAYFGVEIGWAPIAGWSCASSFELPSAFVKTCGKVTWWKPSSGWLAAHTSLDLDFTPPSFWGIISVPSRSWKCNGSGKDGWSVDIYGNGRPSWVPSSGWAYFGVEIGWAPIAGWSCSSSFELPSVFVKTCGKVTWWKPSSGWLSAHTSLDLDFTPPSFWGIISVPSRSWKCNGSGKDGWSVDIYGNGRPSWVPSSGWAYFGVEIGWAPIAGWSCSSSFELPSTFVKSCGKVTWWKPSSGWLGAHTSFDLDFTPPSFWGVITVPSRGWKCNGKGTDGFEIDYQGNKAPSWVPSGWLWFGVTVGWAPPASWTPSSSWTIPRQWEGSLAHKCTWWKPSSAWKQKHRDHDFGWSLPVSWEIPSCGCSCGCGSQVSISTTLRPTTTFAPPKTTARAATTTTSKPKTTTSSKPKTTTSSKRKTTTSSKPKTTTTSKPKTSTSSKPKTITTSKKPATTTSKKPASTTSRAAETTKPPSTKTVVVTGPTKVVTVTETETVPAPVSTPSRPGSGWSCNGSGNDGWKVDHNGNSCPSHLGGGGWLWFGSSIGWAPPKGWSITVGWKPSSLELTSCGRVDWWLPPTTLIIPGTLKCPLNWTLRGWIDKRIPSRSFECDGSGEDGFDFDHDGKSRPSWAPVGFQYFGRRGWQPCKGFTPSASWSVSYSWQAHYATWWQPTRQLTLRSNFRCPSWWRKSYLRGSWRWL
ncbi:hypothetical protein JCM6882_003997 [Rhodosporidiobolus microsporus]